jgi:MEMO1 family protein
MADKKQDTDIRSSVVAGSFYPASPSALRRAVEGFMDTAAPVRVHNPIAMVLPHAGYIYSAQTAADGYRQAMDHHYDVVVILGTNHTSGSFHKISLYAGDGFETPLGTVEIDKEVVAALMAADPDCLPDQSLHVREHSIEVQLPFIQVLFPDARIVPAVVGTPDINLCIRFGEALAAVLKNRDALIIASSDLSHYPDAKAAEDVDGKTLAAMEKIDPALFQRVIRTQMNRHIPNLHTCACGEAPIIAAMGAAKAMGAKYGTVISYTHSGNTPAGEQHRVVGYGAVAFSASPALEDAGKPSSDDPESQLTDADKKALLALARETITNYLTAEKAPTIRGLSTAAKQARGVFVTLKKRGNLRGCIGRMIPDKRLDELVGTVALQSAFEDPRFRPVTADEMKDLEIEISVLTPMKPISGPEEILVGRDGVLLCKGGRSAVFLPQVAPEQGWQCDEMLDHLCMKAGLPRETWRHDVDLSTFQAIVFSESDFMPER